MNIFQVIAIFFAVFMSYTVSIYRRKAHLSVFETSIWYAVWILFVSIAVFPHLLLGLAGILRFERVFDLLVVIAFMFITYLVIHSYLIQKEVMNKIEDLVRKQAIHPHVKENKKN